MHSTGDTTTWARRLYDGTVVVVTGAGSGVGQAIARAFFENGASALVVCCREQPLRKTVEGFPPERVLVYPADVADRAEAEDMNAAVVECFGRLERPQEAPAATEPLARSAPGVHGVRS